MASERLPGRIAAPKASNVRVLKPAPPAVITRVRQPWDSYFVWMLGTSLCVVLPFFVLATFFNLPQWGRWIGFGAMLMLIGILALSTWWMVRPVRALSPAGAAVGSGD